MKYPVKLKTGFFETRNYDLEVQSEELFFKHPQASPLPDIHIPFSDLLEFSISDGKVLELEITTRENFYTCILNNHISISALAEELFVKSRKKIRIEEERK